MRKIICFNFKWLAALKKERFVVPIADYFKCSGLSCCHGCAPFGRRGGVRGGSGVRGRGQRNTAKEFWVTVQGMKL